MTGWNLPPGCSDNDLPGNRPGDEEWDDFLDSAACEAVHAACEALGGEPSDELLEDAFKKWRDNRRAAEAEAADLWHHDNEEDWR